jgi:hypothetical protein
MAVARRNRTVKGVDILRMGPPMIALVEMVMKTSERYTSGRAIRSSAMSKAI